jgi:hypothetical protein
MRAYVSAPAERTQTAHANPTRREGQSDSEGWYLGQPLSSSFETGARAGIWNPFFLLRPPASAVELSLLSVGVAATDFLSPAPVLFLAGWAETAHAASDTLDTHDRATSGSALGQGAAGASPVSRACLLDVAAAAGGGMLCVLGLGGGGCCLGLGLGYCI